MYYHNPTLFQEEVSFLFFVFATLLQKQKISLILQKNNDGQEYPEAEIYKAGHDSRFINLPPS